MYAGLSAKSSDTFNMHTLWKYCLPLLLLAGPGTACLADQDECGGNRGDCELAPVLATYLAFENFSFRVGACGTFGPADWAIYEDAMQIHLPVVGPVSVVNALNYDVGILNRPFHLIGCEPRVVHSSQSVNAGAAVARSEFYIYRPEPLVGQRIITTPMGTFTANVLYSPADYPVLLESECPNIPGTFTRTITTYDVWQRTYSFRQARPANCDAPGDAQRTIEASLAYNDNSRLPYYTDTLLTEVSGGTTTVTVVRSTTTYTRGSGGRILSRNQTDDITQTVTPPGTTATTTRTLAFNYTYDSAGRVSQFVGNRGPTTNSTITYGYDAANRLTSIMSTGQASGAAANSSEIFTYDASGRITAHTSNVVLGPNTLNATFTFEY